MTPEQARKLDELYAFMQQLKRFDGIPLDTHKAFQRRLGLDDVAKISASSVAVATYTQAVNEAGSGNYNVAKIMTGFKTLTDNRGNSITVATY